MGKKGKKKSGKKSGKKGKKKGAGEPLMTFREAILAYQINIKEKQIEDFKYELRGLEEKNRMHRERNERLNNEQVAHMKRLLKQAKEFEKRLESADIINKEQVISVMKDKWTSQKDEEQSLEEMRRDIKKKDDKIASVQKDVTYWLEYKNRGENEHKSQIIVFEQELVDMKTSFDEMTGHLDRQMDVAKDKILTRTEDKLANQKYEASEQAMSQLDKNSRQEVLDNDWLKREVEIHKEEASSLRNDVEDYEKFNLNIMSELFECRVEDLKISRNIYLTQFEEDVNLEEGILEMDLAKVSLKNRENQESIAYEHTRPKSAMQQSVEDKVFSLVPSAPEAGGSSEDEEDYDGVVGDENEEDPYDNYIQFADETRFDDYLRLGPVELKLLNLAGTKKPLHRPAKQTEEEMEAKQCNPDQWPVTPRMLKDKQETAGFA